MLVMRLVQHPFSGSDLVVHVSATWHNCQIREFPYKSHSYVVGHSHEHFTSIATVHFAPVSSTYQYRWLCVCTESFDCRGAKFHASH